MNFNVHRRNKSLFSQTKLRDKRDHKSSKKMPPAEALLQQAKELYYSQTQLEEAVALFEQYLAIHPNHNDALYLSAVTLLHLGRPDDAIDKLTAVSEDYQNKPNALLLAAMAFNKLGNVGRSLETVNECIRKYQGFEEAVCFRAKIYMGMNFYHKAEVDFKSIVTSNPNPSFLTFLGLADCYRFQGKLEKALALYHHALQLLPHPQHQQQPQLQQHQIQLKIGICLYQLERTEESVATLEAVAREGMRSSEVFYYLGQAQVKLGKREQGLLSLEYCLRMQTSQKIARKAYRRLLHLYLDNHQFYEALNVVRLGDIANVDLQWWRRSVEAFMLVIKGNYELGVSELTAILEHVKATEEQKRTFKIKRDSSDDKSRRETRYQESIEHKKLLLSSPNKHKESHYYYSRDNYYSRDKMSRKLGYFSTKSVLRAVPKIESTRLNTNCFRNDHRLKTEDKLKTEHLASNAIEEERPFSSREKELMVPLLLLFKAYGEFFLNSFMKCLDTYEEYESFIKDMFGRESDVAYNKTLCQALLMGESEMTDDALLKFTNCLDLYYQKNNTVPQEPLLYKVMLLIRLAISREGEVAKEEGEGEVEGLDGPAVEVLQSALQLMDSYKGAIGGHFLSHYFRALIYILLGRLEDSRQALERTFKVTEECSWRLLYVKGVVEMQLGNYYQAVKEFSAGLILQNRAEFYLGRSISFLRLSEKEEQQVSEASIQMLMKSVHISSELSGKKESRAQRSSSSRTDLLVENCFQDLQKYIELENNQEEISLWVSKILFANRAYDEAIRSLTKISKQTPEVLAMIECIEVYEGELDSGGAVGAVLRQAFEGAFLNEEEETEVLGEHVLKNYNAPEYGYLSSEYEKWLVVLHLFVRQQYPLLVKYLQKEIFACQDDLTQFLLRYNLALLYLLLSDHPKAHNLFKGLLKYEEKFDVRPHLSKLLRAEFTPDECLPDLREEIGIGCSKLLSNYLPFRPVELQEGLRVYVRILVPFPAFQSPSLRLAIDHAFVLAEMTPAIVEKRIEAPWIKKGRNRNIQFTQKVEESVAELDDIANTADMKQLSADTPTN